MLVGLIVSVCMSVFLLLSVIRIMLWLLLDSVFILFILNISKCLLFDRYVICVVFGSIGIGVSGIVFVLIVMKDLLVFMWFIMLLIFVRKLKLLFDVSSNCWLVGVV